MQHAPSIYKAIRLSAFCGGCIATATGIAALLSIGVVPWLVEKYGMLDNAYWEFQVAWATATLCLLCLAFVLTMFLLLSGTYLSSRPGWMVLGSAFVNFIAYSAQSHFDPRSKVFLLAIGVLLVMCASVGFWSVAKYDAAAVAQDVRV